MGGGGNACAVVKLAAFALMGKAIDSASQSWRLPSAGSLFNDAGGEAGMPCRRPDRGAGGFCHCPAKGFPERGGDFRSYSPPSLTGGGGSEEREDLREAKRACMTSNLAGALSWTPLRGLVPKPG